MFNSSIVVPQYKNLLGWKEHHSNAITIPVSLTNSVTGEYFQQKHPALRLDYIQTVLPSDYPLEKYLEDVVVDSTNEIFNDLIQYRQLKEYGKTLLENKTLLNRYGFGKDKIINQNRFVGLQIRMMSVEALSMIIKSIGLQFDDASSFKMYLFHSSKTQPVKEIDVTTTSGNGWDWQASEVVLTGMKEVDYNGGVFVLGYYQEDLSSAMAINNTNFDWDKGECGSCNSPYASIWKSIAKYYHIYPIYVPSGSFVKGEMFDLNDAFYINNKSWGMNLRLSTVCDLTDFFIENRFAFKNLLALKVVHKVLKMMQFSTEINSLEEEIKMMIIRDLEADKETRAISIPQQYKNEMKAVSWNISMLNGHCLKCEDSGKGPTYSVI